MAGRFGGVSLHSSTQHPSETQEIVARVLGVPRHMVDQWNACAWAARSAARKRRPIVSPQWRRWARGRPAGRCVSAFRARLDMSLTGKRHPFLARFAAGFDGDGRLQAARIQLYADGGWSLDLSEAILGRAMFHVDNAYYAAGRGSHGVCVQDAQDVADRFPRLRRTAGHAGDRRHPGPDRARLSNCRRTSSASATSTARASPRTTASR